MKDSEFVKLIQDLVRSELAKFLKSGGDLNLNARGNIFLNPTGKAYYKNTEIGSGSGSGSVGPGTVNSLAKFTPNTTSIGDSGITDNGTLITLTRQNVDLHCPGSYAYLNLYHDATLKGKLGTFVGSSVDGVLLQVDNGKLYLNATMGTALDMGGLAINSVGNVDGVDVSAIPFTLANHVTLGLVEKGSTATTNYFTVWEDGAGSKISNALLHQEADATVSTVDFQTWMTYGAYSLYNAAGSTLKGALFDNESVANEIVVGSWVGKVALWTDATNGTTISIQPKNTTVLTCSNTSITSAVSIIPSADGTKALGAWGALWSDVMANYFWIGNAYTLIQRSGSNMEFYVASGGKFKFVVS